MSANGWQMQPIRKSSRQGQICCLTYAIIIKKAEPFMTWKQPTRTSTLSMRMFLMTEPGRLPIVSTKPRVSSRLITPTSRTLMAKIISLKKSLHIRLFQEKNMPKVLHKNKLQNQHKKKWTKYITFHIHICNRQIVVRNLTTLQRRKTMTVFFILLGSMIKVTHCYRARPIRMPQSFRAMTSSLRMTTTPLFTTVALVALMTSCARLLSRTLLTTLIDMDLKAMRLMT